MRPTCRRRHIARRHSLFVFFPLQSTSRAHMCDFGCCWSIGQLGNLWWVRVKCERAACTLSESSFITRRYIVCFLFSLPICPPFFQSTQKLPFIAITAVIYLEMAPRCKDCFHLVLTEWPKKQKQKTSTRATKWNESLPSTSLRVKLKSRLWWKFFYKIILWFKHFVGYFHVLFTLWLIWIRSGFDSGPEFT